MHENKNLKPIVCTTIFELRILIEYYEIISNSFIKNKINVQTAVHETGKKTGKNYILFAISK